METGSLSELFSALAASAFGVVAAVGGGLIVFAAAVLGGLRGRRRRDPAELRQLALRRLGYTSDGGKRWVQPLQRTRIVFHELPDGGMRWTVQLTRYNTLTLQVEELNNPSRPLIGTPFSTGIHAMDERFLTSSEKPAQCMALASNAVVVRCMLAMPFLSMHVRGDELVVEDLARRGRGKLLGDDANPRLERALAAEQEMHQSVMALCTAILDTLYTRTSGTLFAEHK